MKLYPEAFELYADTSGRLRTKASRQSFKYVLAGLQRRHPNTRVDQFTEQALTTFCLEDGLAPRTRKHRRAVLRSFFEWAQFRGLVKASPAAALKFTVVTGAGDVRPGHWLDEGQVGTLLRACPAHLVGRRDRLILLVGFMTGLRRMDFHDLTWDQFSSDLSTVTVVGKGGKLATLGIPAQLRSELEEWRALAPVGARAVFPSLKNAFEGRWDAERADQVDWSKPLGGNGVYHAVKRAALRCEIELSPHDLRRSFAGILENKGVPVTDIQRAMRHSNVGTTSVYLDRNPAKAVRVTEGLTFEL